ncbi:MAG: oligosaccharide flippase family protein, partial [Candidatus Odinarchaeia archaeon]
MWVKTLAKNTIYYTIGRYVGSFSSFFVFLLIPNYFGAVYYGAIFLLLSVILNYTQYTSIGSLNALTKEVPYEIGKGNITLADEYNSNAFSLTFIITVIIAFISGFMLLFYPLPGIYPDTIFIFSILIIIRQVKNSYIAILRSLEKFKALGLGLSIGAVIRVALIAYMVITNVLTIFLFVLIAILMDVISLLIMVGLTRYKVRLAINKVNNIHLIKIGLPLIAISVLFTAFTSLDVWIVAYLLTPIQLGFYAVAVTLRNFFIELPVSVSGVIFPFYLKEAGKESYLEKARNYNTVILQVISYVFSVLTVFGAVFAPYLFEIFFPDYLIITPTIQIFLLMTPLFGLALTSTSFLISINKEILVMGIYAVTITTLLTTLFSLFELIGGITGIAWGVVLSSIVYSLICMLTAFRRLFKLKKIILNKLTTIVFPLIYTTLVFT